jgi:hypothetical protein
MKKKVSKIIMILGIGLNEIIITVKLNGVTINSIEWSPEEDKIYLHIFDNDLDLEIDFDDISGENQEIILSKLSQITYN